MSDSERDAIDIFGLLYPLLSDGQKGSSEARKAHVLADKYQAYLHDSSKIATHDRILRIVNEQLDAERAGLLSRVEVAGQRRQAYEAILHALAAVYAIDLTGIEFTSPDLTNPELTNPDQPPPEKAPRKRTRRTDAL